MIRILVIIFFTIIACVAVGFSLLNFQNVEINLYIMKIELPLAVALTIELFAGIGIGYIAQYIHTLKLKSENKILSRQLGKK